MKKRNKKKNEIVLKDKFNPKYFPLLFNDRRYLVMMGGGGSGKSHFSAQKVLFEVLTKKIRVLVVRKTAKSLRQSTWTLLQRLIADYNLSDYFKLNKTEMTLKCTITGGEIIHAGLDDVNKLKSIDEIVMIWIEEATEIELEDFLQLDIRLRGKLPPSANYQMILSFNPIDPSHWLRSHFYTEPTAETLEQTAFCHSTIDDNELMDDRPRESQMKVLNAMKEIDETYYEVYRKGLWADIKELIFTKFKVIRTDEFPEHFDEVIYGIDFGFNNPTAIVQVCIKDMNIYLREILYQTGLVNSDLIKMMNSLKIPKYAEIYADSAEPARIEEIARAGYNIMPANKLVKNGIDFVKRFPLYSHPFNVNMNKEFKTYKWKKDRNGIVLDEPVKLNDHTADAARYAIYTHLQYRVEEADASTLTRELNEQALKRYAEDYMELKYQFIQVEGKSEEELKEEFITRAALQEQEYQKVTRYVKEIYNY